MLQMATFATAFVALTFVIGGSFCCLALWTISKSTALRESFGILCKFQMLTDLTLLSVTSIYSLIPKEFAPPDNSILSIIITYIAEICYHYSGAMHDLFAINRFIYIVFPVMQQKWRKITPTILVLCAIVTVLHTVTMTFLDSNLHWVYDRVTHLWRMTDTKWTEFYVRYFELLWSSCEIILILVLDSVTFSFILCRKFKLHPNAAQLNRRVESRLILQVLNVYLSLCQCVPTTTVNVVFFFVLPVTTSPHLKIVCSSIWIVTNLLDAFVIIAFHFPQALAAHRKMKLKLVAARAHRRGILDDSNS